MYSPKKLPRGAVLPAGRVLLVTWRLPKLLKTPAPVAPAAVVMFVVRFTPENCGWLRTLNASMRSCRVRRPPPANGMFLKSDRSWLLKPGLRR